MSADPLPPSWRRWWNALAAPQAHALSGPARRAVVARWSESGRHYHAPQHLRECLAAFDEAATLAQRPAEVEAALWFHDAVYDPHRHDNEARSADLWRTMLEPAGIAEDTLQRVAALVLATRHGVAEPASADAALVVDIDLAILGAPRARFAEYERQIRAEYAFVPIEVYREKRRAVLQGFAQRPRLYTTAHFHARCDAPARENLARALAAD